WWELWTYMTATAVSGTSAPRSGPKSWSGHDDSHSRSGSTRFDEDLQEQGPRTPARHRPLLSSGRVVRAATRESGESRLPIEERWGTVRLLRQVPTRGVHEALPRIVGDRSLASCSDQGKAHNFSPLALVIL